MFNRSGYAGSLGFYLFLFSFLLGFFAIRLIAGTYLLWHGVAAQGVVVAEKTMQCGKSPPVHILSIRFIDRAGQAHTSTTTGDCASLDFDASPGGSIPIVYLPDNPAVIASTDQIFSNAQFNLIGTILLSLISLVLLPFWIRKRLRKRSLHPEVDAGLSSTATGWREQIKEETSQGVGGEEAAVSGTSEIAPKMSPLLSGVQRVSKRIDRMMADAIDRREALHWAAVVQLLEDITNNPHDIAYITRLARVARDLQGLLQLHQFVMNTMAENNGILHDLIQDALRWSDSERSETMSPLLSGLRQVSERIDRMMADAAQSREALHWVAVVQLLEDTTNNPREIAHVIKLASSARDLQGLLQLHQNMLNRAAENNHLLRSLISEASCNAEEPVRNNGYTSD